MTLFNAFCLEPLGAEFTFVLPALMYVGLMFLLCLTSVIYFSAGGACYLLWWARGLEWGGLLLPFTAWTPPVGLFLRGGICVVLRIGVLVGLAAVHRPSVGRLL